MKQPTNGNILIVLCLLFITFGLAGYGALSRGLRNVFDRPMIDEDKIGPFPYSYWNS